MDCFTGSHRTPGAQGVIYDTALRGVHHQTLLRDLGLCPSTGSPPPPKARTHPKRPREAKSTYIEGKSSPSTAPTDASISTPERGRRHRDRRTPKATSTSPTPRIRTHRNADKNGKYRWYNDYRLPDHLGGGIITVRLHGNDDDAARKFNRTENVRPIPPTTPTSSDLFRRRNDAETINRALDDTLWLRRAHSIGHARQLLNLLGYALMVNSLATRRHTPAPVQLAA